MVPKIIRLNAADQRIVVFSDTHLSSQFDLAQFEFLKEVIESVDRVIINGDFWDYGETTFSEFIDSKWSQLFPLLKSKKTVYLYGNHDLEKFSDQRINLFSTKQGDHCVLKAKDRRLIIRHGCYLAPSNDIKFPRIFSNQPMLKFGDWLNLMGVRLAKDYYLKMFFTRNAKMKKMSKSFESGNVLVCGHSHLIEENLSKNYINTGVIRWGLGQYLLVDGEELRLAKKYY